MRWWGSHPERYSTAADTASVMRARRPPSAVNDGSLDQLARREYDRPLDAPADRRRAGRARRQVCGGVGRAAIDRHGHARMLRRADDRPLVAGGRIKVEPEGAGVRAYDP